MVFSKYTDLLPKEVLNEDADELRKPDEETVQEVGDLAECENAGCFDSSHFLVFHKWGLFLSFACFGVSLNYTECISPCSWQKRPDSLWTSWCPRRLPLPCLCELRTNKLPHSTSGARLNPFQHIARCFFLHIEHIDNVSLSSFSPKGTPPLSRESLLTQGPNRGWSAWWKCKKTRWNLHVSSKSTCTTKEALNTGDKRCFYW